MTIKTKPATDDYRYGYDPIFRKMHVEYINPPIPSPNFNWEATFIGHDKGDPIGYGATRQDAIDDLLEKEDSNALALHPQTARPR